MKCWKCEVTNTNESDISESTEPKGERTKLTRLCLRILAVTFSAVVVISIVVAVTLILTQKPVDLSERYGLPSSLRFRNDSLINRLPGANYTKLTMAELASGTARESRPPFTQWLANNDLITTDDFSTFFLLNSEDDFNTTRVHINQSTLASVVGYSNDVIISSNGEYFAFVKHSISSHRYSNLAIYEIHKVVNGTLSSGYKVGTNNGYATLDNYVQLFMWNPHLGSNDYVIVYNNNLYYNPTPTDSNNIQAITTSSSRFKYNGIADWLYEEEIFGTSTAVWWSPSGNLIAYASFDDEGVELTQLPHHVYNNVGPTYDEYPYPTAGTKRNPIVNLWIWDKRNKQTYAVAKPKELENLSKNNTYLFSVRWIVQNPSENSLRNEELLLAVWANRPQNQTYFALCDPKKSCSNTAMITQKVSFNIDGRKLWAEPNDFKVKATSNDSLFVLLPRKYRDNVYNHIARISIKNLQIQSYSGGPFDINEIVGYSAAKDEIYFLSAGETIGEMHLYRISKITADPNNPPICISCSSDSCTRAEVDFSFSGNFFLLTCHSPYKVPEIALWDMRTLLKKVVLREAMVGFYNFELPIMKFEKISTDGGIDAHVRLILPPRFNDRYSYPVVLYTYAGPNTITAKATTPWELLTYLANNRECIVVTIDSSGASNRGWNIKERLYKNLGGPEVEDQIEVLKKLLKKHSFLDKSRVAAFGWSYGGFVTLHIGGRDGGKTVQCVVSVAPVVSFLYYDSAYSERYMGLVEENMVGYERSSLVLPYISDRYLENLRNVKLLLAHGNADDNVHYHNSAVLTNELQKRLINFKQLVYPNEGHSLHNMLTHLYLQVDQFLFKDCFDHGDS